MSLPRRLLPLAILAGIGLGATIAAYALSRVTAQAAAPTLPAPATPTPTAPLPIAQSTWTPYRQANRTMPCGHEYGGGPYYTETDPAKLHGVEEYCTDGHRFLNRKGTWELVGQSDAVPVDPGKIPPELRDRMGLGPKGTSWNPNRTLECGHKIRRGYYSGARMWETCVEGHYFQR